MTTGSTPQPNSHPHRIGRRDRVMTPNGPGIVVSVADESAAILLDDTLDIAVFEAAQLEAATAAATTSEATSGCGTTSGPGGAFSSPRRIPLSGTSGPPPGSQATTVVGRVERLGGRPVVTEGAVESFIRRWTEHQQRIRRARGRRG